MSVKLLSEKVSYRSEPGSLQIIVLGKIERWKEALLTAWLLAWIFCGGVVFNEYWHSTNRENKMIYLIFLIFWAYYFWRIGRVWLFRRGGNELIKVQNNTLVLKRSFFTYGKSREFDLEGITDLKPLKISKTSFAHTYENSWWVLGGEKISFEYHGKVVKLAMQISDDTRNRLLSMMKKQIAKNLKSLN
ncbi:MAG: hypothetical protein ABR574_05840 [Cryomorphaceae bacterium]|nr:hypothetical protein [Flavobacteriales bacterium]